MRYYIGSIVDKLFPKVKIIPAIITSSIHIREAGREVSTRRAEPEQNLPSKNIFVMQFPATIDLGKESCHAISRYNSPRCSSSPKMLPGESLPVFQPNSPVRLAVLPVLLVRTVEEHSLTAVLPEPALAETWIGLEPPPVQTEGHSVPPAVE